MCALRDIAAAVPLILIFEKLFGIYGIFIAIAISSIAAYLISFGFVRLKYGKNNWPLMLADKERGMRSAFYEFEIEPETVMDFRRDAVSFLEKEKADKKTIFRTSLLLEELFMLIYEKNNPKGGKKSKVYAECTLIIKDEGVQIITKDDGILFDISRDDVVPDSFSEFAVSCYMEKLKNRKTHLTTMSYNRNTFFVNGR